MGQIMHAWKIIIKIFTFKSLTKANLINKVNMWQLKEILQRGFWHINFKTTRTIHKVLQEHRGLMRPRESWINIMKVYLKEMSIWRRRKGVGRMYSWQLLSMLGWRVDEPEDANII